MTRELELLDRLVAFPTVSDQSNLALVDWTQQLLQNAGFQTTRIPGSDAGKTGLYATLGPQRSGGICLSAHTDVVPVAGQNWTRDPFKLTREGPNVYGRGTTDMKGFVACALAAAERAGAADLKRPLSLVLSYDEEIGCVGIREMMPALRNLLGTPEVVVVGEPTSMEIATGHKGKSAFHVTCRGEVGHSAMAPFYINAIHLAARFVDQIRALQAELAEAIQDPAYEIPYSTLHIGRIKGGRALNMVPDHTTLEMELRHLPQASVDDLTAALHKAAAHVCAVENSPNAISVEPTTSYPGLEIDAHNPVISWAQKLTNGPNTTKVAFGTEAGFFAELGLNAVVVGPGNMALNGHKPDEAIAVRELEACTAMMDEFLSHLSN